MEMKLAYFGNYYYKYDDYNVYHSQNENEFIGDIVSLESFLKTRCNKLQTGEITIACSKGENEDNISRLYIRWTKQAIERLNEQTIPGLYYIHENIMGGYEIEQIESNSIQFINDEPIEEQNIVNDVIYTSGNDEIPDEDEIEEVKEEPKPEKTLKDFSYEEIFNYLLAYELDCRGVSYTDKDLSDSYSRFMDNDSMTSLINERVLEDYFENLQAEDELDM